MTETWLDQVPLPVLFITSVAVVLASITTGMRAGLYRRKAGSEEAGSVGLVVGAVLAMLAFILAFTFGIAANRFDARKQLLLDEVNAIGTAVLRAGLLPEPQRAESRRLLKQYVDIRAGVARPSSDIAKAIADSEGLHTQLWSQVAALPEADLNSHVGALFVESLNQVIDLHTSRVTVALQYRIPLLIWLGLFLMTVLAMVAVGYQFGLSGSRSVLVHVILAITFSLMVLLIADLDRATSGGLQLTQQPMLSLQRELSKMEK
jgi:hypothetical protein